VKKNKRSVPEFFDWMFVSAGVAIIFLGYFISALVTNALIFIRLVQVLTFSKKRKKTK
jgi:hypothetical protein